MMEKADAHFTNVEELPEVESAMLNLKQTDASYRFAFPHPISPSTMPGKRS